MPKKDAVRNVRVTLSGEACSDRRFWAAESGPESDMNHPEIVSHTFNTSSETWQRIFCADSERCSYHIDDESLDKYALSQTSGTSIATFVTNSVRGLEYSHN